MFVVLHCLLLDYPRVFCLSFVYLRPRPVRVLTSVRVVSSQIYGSPKNLSGFLFFYPLGVTTTKDVPTLGCRHLYVQGAPSVSEIRNVYPCIKQNFFLNVTISINKLPCPLWTVHSRSLYQKSNLEST